nr:hypothetical protein [Sicyoidochytrium minutum DNA virus]
MNCLVVFSRHDQQNNEN